MKKIFSFLLVAAMIFSLSACSQEDLLSAVSGALRPEGVQQRPLETESALPSPQPVAGNTPDVTELPAPSPETSEPAPSADADDAAPGVSMPATRSVIIHEGAEKYVRSAFESAGEYSDALENTYSYSYAIPEFISGSIDALSANSQISDNLMPQIEDSQVLMEEGFSLSLTYVGYEAFLNGDLVSVLTHMSYEDEFDIYGVWNMRVDPDSGEMISASINDLYDYTGMSDSGVDLLSATAQCVGNFYVERYKDLNNDYVLAQYQRTVSVDNLLQSKFYLDENGGLQTIAKIYSIAGNDYYSIISIIV